MWSTLISLAHRVGFTRSEAAVALFMCTAILAGSLLSALRGEPAPGPDFRAVFAQHDSLFAERSALPDTHPAPPAATAEEAESANPDRASAKNGGGIVNINTAGTAELRSLPGIGEATANKIVAWRTGHGRFNRTEDIMDVPSIGEKKFEKLRHRITVE